MRELKDEGSFREREAHTHKRTHNNSQQERIESGRGHGHETTRGGARGREQRESEGSITSGRRDGGEK